MMKTINFESLFSPTGVQASGFQKRVDVHTNVPVYYGLSPDGYLRLAFRSNVAAPKLESTKLLRVTQGQEGKNVYWCCFDLLNNDARQAFYAFCENLVETVSLPSSTEYDALLKMRKRYICWKSLFKKNSSGSISYETIQGLFGELYYLLEYMVPKYGAEASVRAWGGAALTSKDFAIGSEWYEIKTVGVNTACVTISSLGQLSSAEPGHLVVIKAEHMPDAFSNGKSSIPELIPRILSLIDDELVAETLISQIAAFGVDAANPVTATKFECRAVDRYTVNDDFPRITTDTVPFSEITNVSYKISIAAISRFMEG